MPIVCPKSEANTSSNRSHSQKNSAKVKAQTTVTIEIRERNETNFDKNDDNSANPKISQGPNADQGASDAPSDNRATNSTPHTQAFIEKEKQTLIEKEKEKEKQKEKDTLPPSTPEDAWHFVYQELRTTCERVASLEKIEKSTELHTQQLGGVVQSTSALEMSMDTMTTKIRALNEVISTLKYLVESQGQTIANLQHIKEKMVTRNKKWQTCTG